MVFTRKPDLKSELRTSDIHRTTPSPAGAVAKAAGAEMAVPTEDQSVIGNDLSIEGQSITIRCQGALRINGNIQADMHSKKLVVGQGAVITGAITATDVDVHGRVLGAIYGAHVRLHDGAEVEGDIHSENLQIENGASFDGRSRKVKDGSQITPQLGSGQRPADAPAIAAETQRIQTQPSPTVFPTMVTTARDRNLHG